MFLRKVTGILEMCWIFARIFNDKFNISLRLNVMKHGLLYNTLYGNNYKSSTSNGKCFFSEIKQERSPDLLHKAPKSI